MMRERRHEFNYSSDDEKTYKDAQLLHGVWRWKDHFPIGCQEALGCRVELLGFSKKGLDPEDSVFGFDTFRFYEGDECAD